MQRRRRPSPCQPFGTGQISPHFRQVLKIQVRVDLRGGNVGMPQKFLNAAQIRAGFEQMGGKRMPEHVRMHMHFQAHAPGPGIHAKLDRARRETPSAAADEYGGAVAPGQGGALAQPFRESIHGHAADRKDARLAAFAVDADGTILKVESRQIQADEFAQAQPRGVEQFHHGLVACG